MSIDDGNTRFSTSAMALADNSGRIGKEGDGFKQAQSWINAGRIRHGTRSLGVIKRCLELGKAYAKQRKTFGAPLADRQSVQWPLMLIVFPR